MEQLLFESEDSSTINTSFIERLNLTIRQSCAYLGRRTAFDLVVLDVILLFQDVSGWKLQKMVKDLVQDQKGNPYKWK